jgi:hypothetical protein
MNHSAGHHTDCPEGQGFADGHLEPSVDFPYSAVYAAVDGETDSEDRARALIQHQRVLAEALRMVQEAKAERDKAQEDLEKMRNTEQSVPLENLLRMERILSEIGAVAESKLTIAQKGAALIVLARKAGRVTGSNSEVARRTSINRIALLRAERMLQKQLLVEQSKSPMESDSKPTF